jgi:hypothetical protein
MQFLDAARIWITGFMRFLIFSLLIVFGLGLPFSLLLPRSLPDRWSVAPIFGLALFGILATMGYFHNVPIGAVLYIAAASAALILAAAAVWASDRIWLASLIGFGTVVGAICLAPLWVGGSQFAIFQANPSDQFNYMSLASAVSAESYGELAKTGPDSDQTFLQVAAGSLTQRPTVSILEATLRPWFYLTTAEAAYPFQAFLQTISAFGMLFVARNIFGAGKLIGLVVSAAFAVGFFPQYVSDINAWSSLAALTFGLVIASLICVASSDGSRPAITAPLSLVSAGLLYFYPESSAAGALPCLTAFILCFTVGRGGLIRSAYVVAAGILAIAACFPAWDSTILFLFSQLTKSAVPTEWFFIYDAFYFGERAAPTELSTLYDVMSAPIDILVGAFGVYFLSPQPGLDLSLRAAWKLGEYSFVCALIGAAVTFPRVRTASIFSIACFAAILLPLILVASGQYWSAGKAVSMASPFIFVGLVAPLFSKPGLIAVPAGLLVLLHLGFGVERIFAAADPSAVRGSAGYPALRFLKDQYDWNLTNWRADLAGCKNVAVDIEDPHLERLAETFLSDLHLRSAIRTNRKSNYDRGETVPASEPLGSPDCELADNLSRPPVGKLIYLAKDRYALDFYLGKVSQIDLINEPATGVYYLETYKGGELKWTNGRAIWSLPYIPETRALAISLWREATPPGTTIRVLIDGYEIASGPVWEGVREFPVFVKGPSTLSIESSTFRAPNDPRQLGLPLKSIVIARMGAQEQGQMVTELPDGSILAAGKWTKTAPGTVEIPFGVTFADPPFVVVSPNFSSQVAGVETVEKIDRDKFRVSSANFAPGFSISWIALGKK